jgi:hypothetical protein
MAKLTMPNEAANALSVARAHGFVLRGQRDGFATYQEQRRSRNRHGHQKSDLARRRGARWQIAGAPSSRDVAGPMTITPEERHVLELVAGRECCLCDSAPAGAALPARTLANVVCTGLASVMLESMLASDKTFNGTNDIDVPV